MAGDFSAFRQGAEALGLKALNYHPPLLVREMHLLGTPENSCDLMSDGSAEPPLGHQQNPAASRSSIIAHLDQGRQAFRIAPKTGRHGYGSERLAFVNNPGDHQIIGGKAAG
jgi:hypothetical protein